MTSWREGPASARSKEPVSDKKGKSGTKSECPEMQSMSWRMNSGKLQNLRQKEEAGTVVRGKPEPARARRGPGPYSRGSGALPKAFDRGRAGGAHGRQHDEGKVPTKSRRCGFQERPPTPAPRMKVLNTAGTWGDRA